MVFGLALSLGALILINQPLQTPEDLYLGLLMFGFSFVILVTVWYNYATIMTFLPVETRGLIVANLALLFVVAIEPYLLYVVATPKPGPVAEAASVVYAIDLAAMNVVIAGFMHVLSQEEKRLVAPAYLRRMRVTRNFTLGSSALFLLSTMPVFWSWTWLPGIPARVVLWIVTLPAGWVVRALNR